MKKLIAFLLCTTILATGVMVASCSDSSKDDTKPTKEEVVDKEDNNNDKDDKEDKDESAGDASDKNDGGAVEGVPEDGTYGAKLYGYYSDIRKNESDPEAIATAMCDSITDYGMGSMPVEEGFLNGFTDEIKGFSKGATFAPMIGSIPFVGYIFETDDPDALITTLNDKADMRWNICTEADEMVCVKDGNLVLFIMCPNE